MLNLKGSTKCFSKILVNGIFSIGNIISNYSIVPPFGYDYIIDDDGNYLVDDNGNYIVEKIIYEIDFLIDDDGILLTDDNNNYLTI